MNELIWIVLIIAAIIGIIIIYKILKPYFIKYDSTLCITGGLGSGKTITCVKTAVVLLRKNRFFKWKIYNGWHSKINWFKAKINKRHLKYNIKNNKKKNFKEKRIYELKKLREKPMLYSNIPIHFKKHILSSKREWNKTLTAANLLCLEEIREYSIVFIDELPQFINQFNWNQELIQKNVNEFITFFRHYIGGYLIVNAQAIDDVVVQIRRKLNQATWCFDFHKWCFGLFYTIRMCDLMLSDSVQTISTTYIEENTRIHFGLFPPRKTYDSRCYSKRYENVYKKYQITEPYRKLKTNKVLRLVKYTSPLDDTTTEQMKQEQWNKGEQIWKN